MAAIVAAVLGWTNATFGQRELKALAIVVLGWTAVTTTASIPNFNPLETLLVLVLRTLVIALPYSITALAKRWRRRRG